MLVATDTFLIQIENALEENMGITGVDGKQIKLDTDYNTFDHSCRIGKIFACPVSISQQYSNDTKLSVGDTVIFHHFVTMPDHHVNIAPGNIYRSEYFHIYAKLGSYTEMKNNTWSDHTYIIPIEDAIFVEPILEPEENMFSGSIQVKTQRENLVQQGKVFALSKRAKAAGLLEGDHVHFTHNAEYEMKIIDNHLWRMRIRNITLVIRDGGVVCLADKVLIQEHPTNQQEKLFCEKKTLQLNGEVIAVGGKVKGVEAGTRVNYYNSIGGSVNFEGNNYAFVEPRHINYIL